MSEFSRKHGTWRWATADLYVCVDSSGVITRQVAVRDPYLNESDGKRFVLTGGPHRGEIFTSLDDAVAAALASSG